MTKAFVLDWHIPVDKPLLEGDTFDRWSEEEVEEGCRFKVDQDGFFISWKSEGREAEVLDLSQVTAPVYIFKNADRGPVCAVLSFLLADTSVSRAFPNFLFTKVNDIRPGADPVNERIKSQLVAKHGQDFKSKVVVRQRAPILFEMMPVISLSIL